MSQLWGMLKNPALFVNSEIAGQIPLVPSSASRVHCMSDWYTAPLVVKEGSPRGEDTTGLTKAAVPNKPRKTAFTFFTYWDNLLTPEEWVDSLFGNIGNSLPTYTV
jgi:hypothetical protein